jgi:hypothetical protein
MYVLDNSIRWRYGLLSEELTSCLLPFLHQFIHHYLGRSTESFFRFALISIADLCLQLCSDIVFSIPFFWDFLPEDHRLITLLFYMQDSMDTFCRAHRSSDMISRDFAFGLAQLPFQPISVDWLELFQCLSAICTDHRVFEPFLPMLRQSIQNPDMILNVIDILSCFCALQVGPDLHIFCFNLGGEISALLRQKWSEVGDIENLEMLSMLWTNLLSIEDENQSLFESPFIEQFFDVLNEFFVVGDLLLSCVQEFDSCEEWSCFFKAAMKMTQCFSTLENKTFIAKVFDLFLSVLNAGVAISPTQCEIHAAFICSLTFLAEYLAAKVETPSPGLLIIARDLARRFPRELLSHFCAHLPAFTLCCPSDVILDFISAVAEHIEEVYLDLFMTIVIREFQIRPEVVSFPLERLCRRFHAQIITENERVLELLMAALVHLEWPSFFWSILSFSWLVLHSLDPVSYLSFLGSLPIQGLRESRFHPELMISLVGKIVCILEFSSNPIFHAFCISLVQEFFPLCSPFWMIPEFQGVLSQMVRDLLKHNLLEADLTAQIAIWVNGMILDHGGINSGYIECLPYLAEFGPLENVTLFLTQFDPLSQSNAATSQRIVTAITDTLRIMLSRYNTRTWDFIPIQIVFCCIEKGRFGELFVTIVGEFLESFPPEAVLEIVRVIYHLQSQESKPHLLKNLFDRLPAEYIVRLCELETTPTICEILIQGLASKQSPS